MKPVVQSGQTNICMTHFKVAHPYMCYQIHMNVAIGQHSIIMRKNKATCFG